MSFSFGMHQFGVMNECTHNNTSAAVIKRTVRTSHNRNKSARTNAIKRKTNHDITSSDVKRVTGTRSISKKKARLLQKQMKRRSYKEQTTSQNPVLKQPHADLSMNYQVPVHQEPLLSRSTLVIDDMLEHQYDILDVSEVTNVPTAACVIC